LDLTPREQEVWDLRNGDQPLTARQIAKRLKISLSTVNSALRRIQHKLDLKNAPRAKPDRFDDRVECKRPAAAAEFFDKATNPLFENVAKAARECGLTSSVAEDLMRRLETEYLPVKQEVERVKTDVLVREFEGLAKRALQSIKDDEIEELNVYQRTLVAAIAVDKRELLDGRPTERISHEDRRDLPEMMALLLKEAQRRGLTAEVNPDTNRASLVPRADATYQALAGRERMAVIDVEVAD
jgi:DNA-binding CsgD family transcriptional regulator